MLSQLFNWCVGDSFTYYSHQEIGTFSQGHLSNVTHSYSTVGFSVVSRIDVGDSITYSLLYFDTATPTLFVVSKSQSTYTNNIFSCLYRGICSDYDYHKDSHSIYHDIQLSNYLTDAASYSGSWEQCKSTFVERMGIKSHYFSTGWQGGVFKMYGIFNTICVSL